MPTRMAVSLFHGPGSEPMKVLTRQLGTSTQRLITVPAGTTLGVATAPTIDDLTVDLPATIRIRHLAAINTISRDLFRATPTADGPDFAPIGLVLQQIFGTWLTVLESIVTPAGPTWHLIEGPIQLPISVYRADRGLTADQSILGIGIRR